MSRRWLRLTAVLLVAAALALATWQLGGPWWIWIPYGLVVGTLLSLAGRDHESEQR